MHQPASLFLSLSLVALFGGTAAELGAQRRAAAYLEEQRAKKQAKPFVAQGGWMLDYDAARARAKREGKVLLVYFTRTYAP